MSKVSISRHAALAAAASAGVSVTMNKDGSFNVGSSLVQPPADPLSKACWKVDGIRTGYVGEAIFAAVQKQAA